MFVLLLSGMLAACSTGTAAGPPTRGPQDGEHEIVDELHERVDRLGLVADGLRATSDQRAAKDFLDHYSKQRESIDRLLLRIAHLRLRESADGSLALDALAQTDREVEGSRLRLQIESTEKSE